MDYPNHIVRLGEPDPAIVAALVRRLAERGYASPVGTRVFDAQLKSLVKLFQAQNVDAHGNPLKVDGEIGPISWAAIFGASPVVTPAVGAAASIALAALAKAGGQVGVMESPLGSNRGREVEAYLNSVGLPGGNFWCMAFVHWCFREAAASNGMANPFPRTAGCLDAWNRVKAANPSRLVSSVAARANPAIVKPGMVFILDFGGGHGHTGFVKANHGGALVTVEGNSNTAGSANGVGVFELSRRSVMSPNLRGFIDFT
jgi:hypothetical protein